MSTDEAAVAVLYGGEGNRRSGVAAAIRHGVCIISTSTLNGLRKGDEHAPLPSTYKEYEIMEPFTLIKRFMLYPSLSRFRP